MTSLSMLLCAVGGEKMLSSLYQKKNNTRAEKNREKIPFENKE